MICNFEWNVWAWFPIGLVVAVLTLLMLDCTSLWRRYRTGEMTGWGALSLLVAVLVGLVFWLGASGLVFGCFV